MQNVLGFILGGGRGAGLYPITKHRSAPAVPVAGQYRLIDIPISNCINSGMQRIYVLTQFLSVSLHRHIANTYKFAPFSRGYVDVLPAQQTNESADWYQGTADALRQNLRYLSAESVRDVLILSGDGLYRMDFADLLRTHRESDADITMSVVPVSRAHASGVGVVRLDETNRLIDLVEKPKTTQQLDALSSPKEWLEQRSLSAEKEYLANMGIYACRRQLLLDLLSGEPQAVDLVTQHFAKILRSHRIQAHLFGGYWQDIGSIRSYYDAHMALIGPTPPFEFNADKGRIYTHMRNLPAARLRASRLDSCLIGEGAIICDGAQISRSVVGLRAVVGRDVVLRDSVVCGADRYASEAQREHLPQGTPDIGIGDGCVIQQAILDKDCRIGANVRIVNEKGVREADADNYVIRDGIVVVPKGAILPAGTVI